mmetsp:Transcript_98694/g.155975  ORF Transcript_98694/g.155975 Transcript_98694/m.155975 type:complete len:687 (+) Transcript_98694:61-2121(+)|eukprot:CAMPEP_0169108328 /NCGR_PEP_ID=MMETSP1015-20121227/25369_1 /TAXON_ID=342587 /ORGANISM="Karlodinium micrum, Strain CCMP2283" /LENGTH=686 /DNA_ID=CAMNT_0009169943 /DNA_START=1 /DNA_END=2061 /DNA_ORIENTATION=-
MEAEEEDDEFDNENFEVDSEVDDASNLQSPKAAEHKEDDDEYDDDPNAFEEDSKDFGSQSSPASGSKAISPSKSIRREATFEAESEEEEATSPSKSLRKEATFEPESDVEEEKLDDDFEAYDGSDVSSPRNASQAEDSKAAEEATEEDERLEEEASRKQASADEKEELDAKQRIEADAARMAAEARTEAEAARRLAEMKANEEAEVKQKNEEDASRLDVEALPETEIARDADEEQVRQEEERELRTGSEETIRQVIEVEAEAEASRKSAEIKVNEEIEVNQINEDEEQTFTAEVEAKEEASRQGAETKAIDRVTSETDTGDMEDKDALHGNRGDVSRAVAEVVSEEQAPANVAIVTCKEEEGTHKNEADADEKRLDAEVEAGEIEQRTEDVEVRSSPKPRFADGPPTELFFDNEGESQANALQDKAIEDAPNICLPCDDAVEQFSHQRRSLNHGEEGEDDDEDDDPVEEQQRGGSGMLQMSASMPTLRGSLAVARRKIPSHLRAPKRKAAQKLPPPAQVQAWDDRHQLCGVENELLPKKLRAYFSRPQSLPELKEDLARRKHMTEARRRLSLEEVPPTKPTAISADSGAPVIPHKHDFGGHMKDRDNQPRPWNNRWSEGIGILNDGMHPSCRQYFSKDSLFAEAPSQRWRRYQDVEVTRDYSQGAARWKPIIDKEGRPPRFPPIGF